MFPLFDGWICKQELKIAYTDVLDLSKNDLKILLLSSATDSNFQLLSSETETFSYRQQGVKCYSKDSNLSTDKQILWIYGTSQPSLNTRELHSTARLSNNRETELHSTDRLYDNIAIMSDKIGKEPQFNISFHCRVSDNRDKTTHSATQSTVDRLTMYSTTNLTIGTNPSTLIWILINSIMQSWVPLVNQNQSREAKTSP